MTTVDYKKNVPVLGSYEVVVAGAGPHVVNGEPV